MQMRERSLANLHGKTTQIKQQSCAKLLIDQTVQN